MYYGLVPRPFTVIFKLMQPPYRARYKLSFQVSLEPVIGRLEEGSSSEASENELDQPLPPPPESVQEM